MKENEEGWKISQNEGESGHSRNKSEMKEEKMQIIKEDSQEMIE